MCQWNPGINMMSRWRFDMRTHLAVTSWKTNTKRRERDIQVNERRSEATNEEQTDEGRNMVRFEQEAPNTSASSDPNVALEHPVFDETPSRPGSVLVQMSGHVDDDVQISALDAFCEIEGGKSRYIGEVLEWYRGEDAGDLERIELDVLLEVSQQSRDENLENYFGDSDEGETLENLEE